MGTLRFFATLVGLGVALLFVSGCGAGTVNFETAFPTAATAQMQSLQGSDFGGHAPLVGAHIYLVQPGAAGYGSVVKGLLTASYAGTTYPTTKNGSWPTTATITLPNGGVVPSSGYTSDQFVPATDAGGNPFYGETTDATGSFNLSGDYTCTVGQPVIVIGYGGSPSFQGSISPPQDTAKLATQELYNDTTAGGYWLTYTVTGTELLYVGEKVTVSGYVAPLTNFNASGTVVVSGKHVNGTAAPLSATSFSMFFAYGAAGLNITGNTTASSAPAAAQMAAVATGSALGGTSAPTAYNPAAVNMAVLGNCPASGNFVTPTATSAVTASTLTANVATFTGANTFSAGQQVALSGFPAAGSFYNGTTATIVSATGAQFTVSFSHANVASTGAGTGTVAGAPLSYIYMNEVSTIATAYAFAGLTNMGATNQAGNDEFHIGTSGTAQALAGAANAAITAGNLYDIQGVSGNFSTVYAGEGHIARAVTPSGLGTVPQATINTLGNILAACVDSTNTLRGSAGLQSAACKVLFQYATDTGVLNAAAADTPSNIAQVAFNLARFPQGTGNTTTAAAFTAALTGIPTGNVPFTPNLGTTAPNDFALAIRWSNVPVCPLAVSGGNLCSQSGLDIDATGNVWVTTRDYATTANGTDTGAVMQLSPAGYVTVYRPPTGGAIANNTFGGLLLPTVSNKPGMAIDAVGTAYAPGVSGVFKFTSGGTPTANTVGASGSVANTNGAQGGGLAAFGSNLYLISNAGQTLTSALLVEPQAGGNPSINRPGSFLGVPTDGCTYQAGFVTTDSKGNIFTDRVGGIVLLNGNQVCGISPAGINAFTYIPAGLLSVGLAPEQLAVDHGDNLWFADENTSTIAKVPAGSNGLAVGVTLFNFGALQNGTLRAPRGVAVDGANTLWFSNAGNGSIVHFGNDESVISPGFYGGSFAFTDPTTGTTANVTDLNFLAVDQSGNVWAGGSDEGQLIQFIGVATPSPNPLSVAKATATVGSKP